MRSMLRAEVSAKSRSRALSGSSQIEFQSRGGRAAEGTNNKENTVWAAPLIVYRYFCFSTFGKIEKGFRCSSFSIKCRLRPTAQIKVRRGKSVFRRLV
jgi:hypothetical protein